MTTLGQFQGVEPAVLALKQRLEDGLPDAIDVINQAHPDDEPVPHPAIVLDYMPSIGELVVFPTIAIGHGPGRLQDDTAWSATGVYDLAIFAFVQHSDKRVMAQYVRRYHLALMRVALKDRNLGTGDGIPWSVVVKNFDFGPAYGMTATPGDTPPNAFMTWTALTVTVKLDED